MTGNAAPVLLAIETAGSGCSAVVTRGAHILAAEFRPLRHGHAEVLLPMIERVVAEAELTPRALQVVAAAAGPGGFTGIRVGLAAAHGIALAAGAELLGISNFAAVAATFDRAHGAENDVLLVALDSRRADFYVQAFAPGNADQPLTPLAAPAAILPEHLAAYAAALSENTPSGRPLWIAGDAAEAAAVAIDRRVALAIAAQSAPDASGIALAAFRQLQRGTLPERVRPLYLRPPDVTLPKRSVPNLPPGR